MKKVELHELQNQILVTGKEALAVEQNGKLLGYFYPVAKPDKAEKVGRSKTVYPTYENLF